MLKTGYDTDKGPAWISVVSFNRSWKTAQWHGHTLRRAQEHAYLPAEKVYFESQAGTILREPFSPPLERWRDRRRKFRSRPVSRFTKHWAIAGMLRSAKSIPNVEYFEKISQGYFLAWRCSQAEFSPAASAPVL